MRYVSLDYTAKEIDFILKHISAARYCEFSSKSPKELAALSGAYTKLIYKLKTKSKNITSNNLITMVNALRNVGNGIMRGIIPFSDVFPEEDVSEPQYMALLRNAFLFLRPYCCELGFSFDLPL